MGSLGHAAFDTAAGDGVADSLPWSGAEAAGSQGMSEYRVRLFGITLQNSILCPGLGKDSKVENQKPQFYRLP